MYDFTFIGATFCRRGSLPFFLANSLQSFASNTRALSELVFRKRKCVTFANDFRFLWERNLDRSEDSELPIYTTVSRYSSSYAPGTLGAKSTNSSLKEYNFATASL
jgi:hypothetical protein